MRELLNQCRLIAKQQFKHGKGCPGDMANLGQTSRVQANAGFRADAWKPFVRQGMKKGGFPASRNFKKCRWLCQLGRNGTHQLVCADALTHGDFQTLAYGFADFERDIRRRLACGSQVEIALVNACLFDLWREVVAIPEHPMRKLLIPLKITGKDNQVWAEFPRPDSGHWRIDAIFAGFVTGRHDDAPLFTPDRDRTIAQSRIGCLFDCREEAVRVYMNDRPLAHGSSSIPSD